MRTLPALALLLTTLLLAHHPALAADPAPPAPLALPIPANALSASLTLKPREISGGTLVLDTTAILENISSAPIPLDSQKTWIHLTVTDSHGQVIHPLSNADASTPHYVQLYSWTQPPLKPKAKFKVPFSLYTPVPQSSHACILQTPAGTWVLDKTDETYFLEGVITFSNQAPAPDAPALKLPKTQIPTTLAPLTPDQTSAKILDLGPKLFDPSYPGQDARKAFSLIIDEKTVIWHRALLNTGEPGLKLYALDHLAQYNSDEALNTIAAATLTGRHNLSSPFIYTAEDTFVTQIRSAAYQALSRSKHPRALQSLFDAAANETNPAIKAQIAALLASHDTPKSRQTLATLAKDENLVVSQEAKLSLDILIAVANKTVVPVRPPIKTSVYQPQHYTLQLLRIYSATHTQPNTEYVFLIGNHTVLKSLTELQAYVATILPPGSSLTWAPGCDHTDDEPLLSDKKAWADFIAQCKIHKVTLIIVPSG